MGDTTNEVYLDALHNGTPIPWEEISPEQAASLDGALATRAARYVDAGDGLRAMMFLNERKKYTELRER